MKAGRVPWSEDEVRTFLVGIRDERLYAPLLLSLCGMRPAEVCGLRWSDVDLDAGTLRVANTRTLVVGQVLEKTPKTEKGKRVLPLPAAVTAALRAYRARQAAEKFAAGPDYTDTGYVLVDEVGEPWRTDGLRRAAYALMAQVGARRVRLYDARHACLTFLAASGVPDVVVSAWAGRRPVARQACLRPPDRRAPAEGVRRSRSTARLAVPARSTLNVRKREKTGPRERQEPGLTSVKPGSDLLFLLWS